MHRRPAPPRPTCAARGKINAQLLHFDFLLCFQRLTDCVIFRARAETLISHTHLQPLPLSPSKPAQPVPEESGRRRMDGPECPAPAGKATLSRPLLHPNFRVNP